MNVKLVTVSLALLVVLQAQAYSILPGQKNAIKTIAANAGFTSQELEQHISQTYSVKLNALSQAQGAEIIKAFQDGLISKPSSNIPKELKSPKSDLVPILEEGMNKRFHFKDGSIREGEIVKVSDNNATLKTTSGNGETFTGMVMGETAESFIIRTKYGDAVVQKRDINNMQRYHGGVLDKQTTNTRKFYKGTDDLTNIFLDPTAFPLAANTFYISGLSLGYGLTERLMMTTRFGSNFSGDLNLHAKMRFYHKKAANKEVAAAWGLGLHRAYSPESIVGQYSHAINLKKDQRETPLNEMESVSLNDIVPLNASDQFQAIAYVAFSSRRANPSGRGKVGWTAGAKTTSAFLNKNNLIRPTTSIRDEEYTISWNTSAQYKIPFRVWLGLEYDLRKNVKFLSTAWIDNGFKTMEFTKTWDDYIGADNSAVFSIDSPGGKPSLIDFDFGIQYAVSESFRFGIHFQQPYLDFYWEFFEF